jgi:oxalate---CoA ligase
LTLEPTNKQGNLRFIRSCSSALAPVTWKQLETRYGVPVLEAYAMTEAAHQMTSNPLPPRARKPGSVGLPQGVQIKTVDDHGNDVKLGEICCRGENVTSGYIGRPEANKESFIDGNWFRTGDQGYIDEDGYLFVTGRIKELINRGGEKISPLEIDAILLSHPSVSEAVSFGVPDKLFGEIVNAAVVLRSSTTEAELIAYCKTKMAQFKCPARIFISKSLQKTATGKIQRRIIREAFLPAAKL